MVYGVPEGSGASVSHGERSSARVPETSLAENETAMKNKISSPNKNKNKIKSKDETKRVDSKMVRIE